MTPAESETARLVGDAQRRYPPGQPPPLPAELAGWLRDHPLSDPARGGPPLLPSSRAADLCSLAALAALAAYGPPEAVPIGEAGLDAQCQREAGGPEFGDIRATEYFLVRGAARGWPRAREALFELIRRVIRPALRWLHRKKIAGDSRSREDDWVEEEATGAGGLILQSLLKGCDCHLQARELSLQEGPALARCRTAHALSAWDGREPLAKFLCRTAVCLHGYHREAMNDFAGLDRYCPTRLAVNEFRHGMLAKAVLLGRLRSGFVLRCTTTPGCPGEIDPGTDCCDGCRRLTEARQPQDFWLWEAGRYRPEYCRLCRTCRYYYFLHRDPCARQPAGGPAHRWSPNGPRQVWVRLTGGGGDYLKCEPESEVRTPRYALTPEALQQYRAAVDTIPAGPKRDLAAELLCEEPDLRGAASARGLDTLDDSFLQEFLDVLWAVPELLPPESGGPFWDDAMAALARCLLGERLSLRQAARRTNQTVNLRSFRQAVLEVLTCTLGAVLRAGSGPVDGDEPGPTAGEPDPGLLEFVAAMPGGDERGLAEEVFGGPVPAGELSERWGLELESLDFARRLLRAVRAVRPGLPFDPLARFAGGELLPMAEILFGDDLADLAAVEDRLRRDLGHVRPREAVLGVLLNVIYAANGLATGAAGDGEGEA